MRPTRSRGSRHSLTQSAASRLKEKIAWASAILTVVFAIYAVLFISVPRPNIWISFTGKVEKLSFRVTNPQVSVLAVGGMQVTTADGHLNGCLAALVVPELGASLEYRRGSKSYFRIIIDPPSQAPNGTSAIIRISGKEDVRANGSIIFEATEKCGGSVPQHLPIWGPAQFGEGIRAADQTGAVRPGFLADGNVKVYARAQERLLGVRFPSTIYFVSSFELPPGGILTSLPEDGEDLAWIGIARVSNEGNGFEIQVSSAAQKVGLGSPSALGTRRALIEEIDLGGYSQFLKDPNIVEIQFFAAVFMFVLQMVLSTVGFFTDKA